MTPYFIVILLKKIYSKYNTTQLILWEVIKLCLPFNCPLLMGLEQIKTFHRDKTLGANTLTLQRVLFEQMACSNMHFSWSQGCHTDQL